MQRKRAKLKVFFHRVNNLLVTAEAMQVPLTDHQVGLRFLDAWLSPTELSAFLAGLRNPALKLQTLGPNAAHERFAQLREELKSFCTGEEWWCHLDECHRGGGRGGGGGKPRPTPPGAAAEGHPSSSCGARGGNPRCSGTQRA